MKVENKKSTRKITRIFDDKDDSRNPEKHHTAVHRKPKLQVATCKKKKIAQLRNEKLRKYLINDLNNYGPVGLIHMNALSSVINRPIRVWKSKDHLPQWTYNRSYNHSTEHPVDVEFHKGSNSNYIGHWTLLGNKDPINVEKELNSCLFAVIAAQIGKDAKRLKTDVIDFLVTNVKYFNREIDDALLHANNNDTLLLFGGARYNGTSPMDAGAILDDSQNVLCHTCRDYGHPRGHASDKDATGERDSVENYSSYTGSMKSGFLSRHDQNKVAHIALLHEKSQWKMQSLNNGSVSETVTLSRNELQQNHNRRLPKMKEYHNGEEFSDELDIIRVTLVLRHHRNEYNNPDANVFVHTIYPRCN